MTPSGDGVDPSKSDSICLLYSRTCCHLQKKKRKKNQSFKRSHSTEHNSKARLKKCIPLFVKGRHPRQNQHGVPLVLKQCESRQRTVRDPPPLGGVASVLAAAKVDLHHSATGGIVGGGGGEVGDGEDVAPRPGDGDAGDWDSEAVADAVDGRYVAGGGAGGERHQCAAGLRRAAGHSAGGSAEMVTG